VAVRNFKVRVALSDLGPKTPDSKVTRALAYVVKKHRTPIT